MREQGYDVAQICLNGHIINDSSKRYPQYNKTFCPKCGERTITKCLKCDKEIQGRYYTPGVIYLKIEEPPAFCHNCGNPYPWTEKKIRASHELAQELEELSEDEKKILSLSLNEIIKDAPGAILAATRIKKLFPKLKKAGAEALKEILTDITSETIKKILWP